MMEFGENSQQSSSHLMAHHNSVSSRVSRRESSTNRHSMGGASTHSRRQSTSGAMDTITTLMRRMSSTNGGTPPNSAGYLSSPHGLSMPTSSLITSLPGAAHFSGGTSVRAHVRSYDPSSSVPKLSIRSGVAMMLGYTSASEVSPNICRRR